MAHSLDLTWNNAVQTAEIACRQVISGVRAGEEAYQELLEALGGRTDSQFAEQLFGTATPDADQIQKVTDLRNAMIACHQMFQTFDGSAASTQDDRASKLRRFT